MWALKKILFRVDFSLPRCFDTILAKGRTGFRTDDEGGVR